MPSILSMGPADPDGSGLHIQFTNAHPTNRRPLRLELRRNDIPGNVRNRPISEVEAWINQWLEDQFSVVVAVPDDPDFGVRLWEARVTVVVHDNNPLVLTATVDKGGTD